MKIFFPFVSIILILFYSNPTFCQTTGTKQELNENEKSPVKNFNLYGDLLIGPIYSATANAEIKLINGKSGNKALLLRLGGGYDGALITDGGSGFLGALTFLKRSGYNKALATMNTNRRVSFWEISAGLFSGKSDLYYSERIKYPVLDIGKRIYYPSGIILRYHFGVLGIGGGIGFAL